MQQLTLTTFIPASSFLAHVDHIRKIPFFGEIFDKSEVEESSDEIVVLGSDVTFVLEVWPDDDMKMIRDIGSYKVVVRAKGVSFKKKRLPEDEEFQEIFASHLRCNICGDEITGISKRIYSVLEDMARKPANNKDSKSIHGVQVGCGCARY